MSARSQPHNLDSEMAVLGAVLLRNEAFDLVAEIVTRDDFYLPAHAAIWEAMVGLRDRNQPIDPVILEAELQARGTLGVSGGLVYMGEVQARVPTAENVESYANRVRDLAILRRLIVVGSEIAEGSYAPQVDLDAWLDHCEQRVFEATQRRRLAPARQLGAVVRDRYREMERRADSPNAVTGVPTGYPDFDRLTHGLQPSELVVLAARPGAGKTAYALNIALNAARSAAHVPVLIVSIEMSADAIGDRTLFSEARVDSWRARSGYLDAAEWGRLTAVVDPLTALAVELDDSSRTIAQIRARARRWRAAHRGEHALVVVDYLQLVDPPESTRSREQQVSWIARQLKALAKEVRAPVIAVSALNRASEESEEPSLRHLREGGEIEFAADLVAFLHRPDAQTPSRVRLLIRKHRNGPIGHADLVYLEQYTRFESAAREGQG